jgi:5-methylcytosine-specific restriction endonuclease McrA
VSEGSLPFVCAWCERVRRPDHRWENASTADLQCPRVTHGICPDCLAEQTRAAAVTAAMEYR